MGRVSSTIGTRSRDTSASARRLPYSVHARASDIPARPPAPSNSARAHALALHVERGQNGVAGGQQDHSPDQGGGSPLGSSDPPITRASLVVLGKASLKIIWLRMNCDAKLDLHASSHHSVGCTRGNKTKGGRRSGVIDDAGLPSRLLPTPLFPPSSSLSREERLLSAPRLPRLHLAVKYGAGGGVAGGGGGRGGAAHGAK